MIYSCGKEEAFSDSQIQLSINAPVSYDKGVATLKLEVNVLERGNDDFQYKWQNDSLTNNTSKVISFTSDTMITVEVFNNNILIGKNSILLAYNLILYSGDYTIDFKSEKCRVLFVYDDSYKSILEYNRSNIHTFTIELRDTNDVCMTEYKGTIDSDTYIHYFLGVPTITIARLNEEHSAGSQGLLDSGIYHYYVLLDTPNCSIFGLNSIDFLVLHWIYFGKNGSL